MIALSNFAAPIVVTAALLLGGAAFSDANAYSRSSSATGPAGGKWSSSGSGSCANGKCTSAQSATGPRGGTVSRAGSTSCGGGKCSGGATYTGPAGNSVTRNRSISR